VDRRRSRGSAPPLGAGEEEEEVEGEDEEEDLAGDLEMVSEAVQAPKVGARRASWVW
jgi:hypothetical protein